MRTSLAEDRSLEQGLLAGIALEQCKRQRAEIWHIYSTKAPSVIESSSEYSTSDMLLKDASIENICFIEAISSWDVTSEYQGIDYGTQDAFCQRLQTMSHELRAGESWLTKIETEAHDVVYETIQSYLEWLDNADYRQQMFQRYQFYERVERLAKEIDEEILDNIPDLIDFDIETFEQHIYERITASINDENLKNARDLLNLAVLLFPQNENYKKLQNILAPPKVLDVKESKSTGIGETISFLKSSGKEYVNSWVAVSRGELLGVSDSYAELVKKYGGEDVIITRIV